VLLSDPRVAAVPVRDRSYADGLRVSHRAVGAAELERLTSRFVAPMAVAPHVAGAAVDLTAVAANTRFFASRTKAG
jgi:hypothetical protein